MNGRLGERGCQMIVKLVEDRDTRVDPVSSWGSVALLSSTTMVTFSVSSPLANHDGLHCDPFSH